MSKRGYLPEEIEETGDLEPSRAEEPPRKRWPTVVAVLISAVLGSALAFAFVTFAKNTGAGKSPEPSPEPSQVETIDTPSASPSAITKPAPSVSEEPAEAPETASSSLDKSSIRVWVFNASGRNGWAGEVAGNLQSAGFVNPLVDNSTTKGLYESTVIYRTSEYASAAQEAARIAGISNVQSAESGNYLIGDTDIEIYLIN